MKILIVEDRPSHMKLASCVLIAAGHDVRGVEDAAEAWDAVGQDRPAVILLDLRLPGGDGMALVRRLKADAATRSIPVVALTAYPDRWTETMALEAGCDSFIVKPIDTRTLAQTLTDVATADSDRAG